MEARIRRLEKWFGYEGCVHGTQLIRSLLPDKGVGWTLALGPFQFPKKTFTGATIEIVVQQAEQFALRNVSPFTGQDALITERTSHD